MTQLISSIELTECLLINSALNEKMDKPSRLESWHYAEYKTKPHCSANLKSSARFLKQSFSFARLI